MSTTPNPDAGDALREAAFLLDRLADFSADGLTEDGARNWHGHVEPSISRLRSALARAADALVGVAGTKVHAIILDELASQAPAGAAGEVFRETCIAAITTRLSPEFVQAGTMDEVHVVIQSVGEYSDRTETPVAAFFDLEQAKDWAMSSQIACQELAVRTNLRLDSTEYDDAYKAVQEEAQAQSPDPSFKPWGVYAEDVRYCVYSIAVGAPAAPPPDAETRRDAEGGRS